MTAIMKGFSMNKVLGTIKKRPTNGEWSRKAHLLVLVP